MTDQKKKKALLKKLRDKYRLVIFNEQSYEELFVMRLSRLNVFTVAGTIAVLLVVLVTLLIAFTGLREYIPGYPDRSEEHTSELQSRPHLVCRLLLEKKKTSKKKRSCSQRRALTRRWRAPPPGGRVRLCP